MRSRLLLRLGLFLYDHLAPRSALLPRSQPIDLTSGVESGPLKNDFTRGFVYSDCWADDSRLVVLNAMDAAAKGAEIATRTTCTTLTAEGSDWLVTLQGPKGDTHVVRARCVVNAAGPWVADVLKIVAGQAAPAKVPIRLVQGSHVIVRRVFEGEHAYLFQNEDGRILFALPYEGRFTLLGTTEVPYIGDPGAAEASQEEIDYLCRAASEYFAKRITTDDVVSSYSGVRPLYDAADGKAATAVTRDYVFDLDTTGRPPLLTVYGGKLTTCRVLAEHAVDQLKPVLGFNADPWTAEASLPGGDIADADFDTFMVGLRGSYPWLPLADLKRLGRAYGTRARDILGNASKLDDLGQHFGGGLTERELDYLRGNEWATTPDDVLWRRSKLGLHLDRDQQQALADWFGWKTAAAVV